MTLWQGNNDRIAHRAKACRYFSPAIGSNEKRLLIKMNNSLCNKEIYKGLLNTIYKAVSPIIGLTSAKGLTMPLPRLTSHTR